MPALTKKIVLICILLLSANSYAVADDNETNRVAMQLAANNPCNPCAMKNPCGMKNPCSMKMTSSNPCNPCGMKKK